MLCRNASIRSHVLSDWCIFFAVMFFMMKNDGMVMMPVRSAADYSSRDVPEEGCSFLLIGRRVYVSLV